jgi:uncharacterized membrane protein
VRPFARNDKGVPPTRWHYNLIAGQSVERIAALSDGVFAVAMTLLVLDLHTPPLSAIHSEGDLWKALLALAPRVLVYLMSFLTLGIFWVGQQTQIFQMERSDRNLTWIYLIFLCVVTLMPFSTSLVAEFISYRIALGVYWLNIFALGAILFTSWRYALTTGLIKKDSPPHVSHAIVRRICIAQALYSFGALLCLVNTYCSIGFILIVQIYYVTAPRLGLGGTRDQDA